MKEAIPAELSYYILVINLCLLLLVYIRSKMVLDFIFFVDRPKSFKRMYKKKHSFIYKSFFGYIFNRQYIQETKHKKSLIRIYVLFILMTVYGLALLFCYKADINSNFKYFEAAYICIAVLYLLWYQLHCSGKGYHWWFPPSWWKGEFHIHKS